VDKRLIGRKVGRNLGSLPGFGNFITLSSFQDNRKCESRMQWLIKSVRYTNGLFERCLKHSFGMPSIQQAFLNFKDFLNICMQHCPTVSGALFFTASSRV
jgi:hypothetical protein